MDEHRKPPRVGLCLLFVAVAVVMLPVIYSLSLGPVCGIAARMESNMPKWLEVTLTVYILPAQFAYERVGPEFQAVVDGYIGLFQ